MCFLCAFPVKDMYDYQGRSYLHVPQDVGINLRTADVPDKCYLPKKQIHVWSGHTKVSRRGGASPLSEGRCTQMGVGRVCVGLPRGLK